jgi:rRNA maturation protein Nop10
MTVCHNCPHCGHYAESWWNFCPRCGATLVCAA